MRLNNYLLIENFRVEKELEKNDFEKKLKKYCSDSASSSTVIFRGDSSKKRFLYIDKLTENRISPYATNNVYNALLSGLPSWKEYPRRNMSMICSTGQSKADSYNASLYKVYPFNGAKIGVCSSGDIWDSFEFISSIDDLDELNNFIEMIISHAYFEKNKKDYDDYDDEYKEFDLGKVDYKTLLKHFNEVDKAFSKNKVVQDFVEENDTDAPAWSFFREIGYFTGTKKKMECTGKKLINCLNVSLSPKKNMFSLVKVGKKIYGGCEVWFEPPCLMRRIY